MDIMTLTYCDKFILTLQQLFEIPNLKHQITNKSQIPNINLLFVISINLNML